MKHIPKDHIFLVEWQVLRIFDWDGIMINNWYSSCNTTPLRMVSVHLTMNADKV